MSVLTVAGCLKRTRNECTDSAAGYLKWSRNECTDPVAGCLKWSRNECTDMTLWWGALSGQGMSVLT